MQTNNKISIMTDDDIYVTIAANGFSEGTLQKIDDLKNDILY